jgi:hypothetical protein
MTERPQVTDWTASFNLRPTATDSAFRATPARTERRTERPRIGVT